MATRIKHKRSSVAGKQPIVSQLESGELAINTADGKVFLLRDDNTVQDITKRIFENNSEIVVNDPGDSVGAITVTVDGVDKILVTPSGISLQDDTTVEDAGYITFKELTASGNDGIGIKAPNTLDAGYNLTLPSSIGVKGNLLKLGASNQLEFTDADAFGGNVVYVSAEQGDDANDGRNEPVKTVKRACQVASGLVYNADGTINGTRINIKVAVGDYTEQNPIVVPDNVVIKGDGLRGCIIRPANEDQDMLRVRNACYFGEFTFRDGVDANFVPIRTWGYAVAFDDPTDVTVSRVGYTNLPTTRPNITVSPYIQNTSIISFLGGSGARIDGSLVNTPNTPIYAIEAENPVIGATPEQGKSMVANAFTHISFGGTGWRLTNDAYAQLVSCFQIFLLNGVYCQSGGYCSITNSATNFGLYALRSSGYSAKTFDFDRSYVTASGLSSGERTISVVGINREAPVQEFIVRFRDPDLKIAYDLIQSEKGNIAQDTVAWINTQVSGAASSIWTSFSYNEAKCARDVRYLLDAIKWDIMFDSNYRTVASAIRYYAASAAAVVGAQKDQTIAAFGQAKTLTVNALSNATMKTRAGALWDEVIDVVTNGTGAADAYSYPNPTDYNTSYLIGYGDARAQLIANKTFIQDEVDAWIAVQVASEIAPFTSSFTYSAATCRRDTGLLIDALVYDLTYGGNLQTYDAALAYFIGAIAQYGAGKKAETIASYLRLKEVIEQVIAETTVTVSAGNSTVQDTAGTPGSAASITAAGDRIQEIADFITNDGTGLTRIEPDITWTSGTLQSEFAALGTTAQQSIADGTTDWIALQISLASVNYTWAWINDTIFGGAREGGVRAVDDQEVYNAIRMLTLNKEFIVQEVTNYVDNYFIDTARTTSAANNTIKIRDTSWLSVGDQIVLSIGETDTLAQFALTGVTSGVNYYVRQLVSSTEFTISATIGGPEVNILVDMTGTFTVTNTYNYNATLCARDVRKYIEAIQWDMEWGKQWSRNYTKGVSFNLPANYKTHYAARYYVNSVIGSQEEDFYYLRNGTGLRLQTIQGLNGDLGAPNAYGTQRPTAGAYASLDPGWGPDDTRAWITARSPYVQNCTTFGNAAIGQKIDGALHNGGNDSIVSNDFTQLISDGIGAWITNNGRAELVSVFTYYSHIGYLAENGGRIRATNGNNSYGTYGASAEGVDAEEVAVTAVVDNSGQYNATVESLFTDGDQLLAIEFGHAGNDYTEAEFAIFGPGENEILVADEFRDDAVQQVRIVETTPGTAGGTGYTYIINTAQAGDSTSITLAATDGSISSAYDGMAIYVTGGAGNGLYGYITTYNSGSKVATVVNDQGTAGWSHVVQGTPFVSPNSSSTYLIEPRIQFTAPVNADTPITLPTSTIWKDVQFVKTADQYIGVTTTTDSDGTGATLDVTRNGSKYYVTLNSGGIGYARLDTATILGTNLGGETPANDLVITATTINSITGAIVEFDFTGNGQEGKFLAIGAGTNGALSVDGESWSAEILPDPTPGTWSSIASGLQDDGSSTFQPSAVILVADGASNIAYSSDSDTWATSTLPAGMNTGAETRIAYGNVVGSATNRFVVISSADRDVAYSDNGGATWILTIDALAAIGYDSIAYGKGKFVAIDSSSTNAAYSADGITWTTVVLPGTAAAVSNVVWGNGKFVTLGGTNGIMYSLDGVTWYNNALTLPLTATERKLAYGQGVFVITSDNTTQVQYSQDGLYWQAYTLTTTITGGYNAIAFGNPAREGKFVILPDASGQDGAYAKIGATAKGRASVANEQVFAVRLTEPGSGYTSAPTITITDPGNLTDVETSVRIAKGSIANPTFVNRGSGFNTASGEIVAAGSNGSAEFFQDGNFVAVRRLTSRPVAGSNIEFASLPGQYFKLVNSISFIGTEDGSYTAFLQISPNMSITDAPVDGDPVDLRIRFSQVRLTGHDFLDVGTGGFTSTNYPGIPNILPDQVKETSDFGGGRVFFTTTDQDGNFRVGDLFSVEQATGVATLNADAFNIAGLQELSLGEVTLGGNSASISEFSTDPFFTANSDTVVPTQRAVKAYIESQIGGGGAALNVNSVTAGDIFVNTNQITTVSGSQINIKANVLFSGAVLGIPQAIQYFLR